MNWHSKGRCCSSAVKQRHDVSCMDTDSGKFSMLEFILSSHVCPKFFSKDKVILCREVSRIMLGLFFQRNSFMDPMLYIRCNWHFECHVLSHHR